MNEDLEIVVGSLRLAMYGDGDMLERAEELAEILAELDGVPCNPKSNRLLLALRMLKNHHNDTYKAIEEETVAK